MKKATKNALCILLLFSTFLSLAINDNDKIDSLQLLFETSEGKTWVKTAIALSDEIAISEPELSQSMLDKSIEYCISNDYPLLLAEAYKRKGESAYIQNRALSGITYYKKAFDIYSRVNYYRESANSVIGMAYGLSRIRKNKESIDTLNYVMHQYSDSISQNTKAEIFELIANNYLENGNKLEGISFLDSAIKIYESNSSLTLLARIYNNLGLVYDDIDDYKNAIYYYDKCKEVAELTQDTLLISYSMHNKANIYYAWGVYDEALDLFLKAKNLNNSMGDESELATSISSIALIYHELKDAEKAKSYYLQAIELAKKYNDGLTVSISKHNLGELYSSLGKYDSALILLNESMKYEMENQNTMGIAESKSTIASVYAEIEKYPLAFEYFKDAEEVFIKFGSKSDLADLYLKLANTHSKINNDSLSIHFYLKGIQIANQINARATALEGHLKLSSNYERLGNHEEALFHYKKFKSLNDTIFSETNSKRIDYMSLRIEKQEDEKELERLENEKKLLKAQTQTQNIRLVFAIIIIVIIIVFFVIMYFFIKRSENRIRQQYQILLESEQKIKALLDASFDSTILVDKDGVIKAANNNNLNGFLPDIDIIINKPIIQLFEETNQKVLQKYIELVYSSKLYKELRIHDADNIVLNIKISPVQDVMSNVSSLAFYIQDITQIELDKADKKKMEEQIVQAQKMETIGTLAGGIAHDFNNYLATIKGYVSMSLDDSEEGSSIQNYLEKTLKAVNLSQETVKKLLTYSRTKEMDFNKFKLDDLITDSIDIVKGSKPKNISFTYPTPHTNLEVLGEKNQLTQVLLNICTNAFHAVEAVPGGEVQLSIGETKLIQDLNNKYCTCIKISDNGIGMKKETLERIFEPFYTTKDVGKGTGLGLSVVTGIMKQHGGKIEVESEFGNGSIFYLYLPVIS